LDFRVRNERKSWFLGGVGAAIEGVVFLAVLRGGGGGGGGGNHGMEEA